MIRYHGTPLSPRSELVKLAGKNFCVSFAEPRDADWCLAHGQMNLWDNGEFKFHREIAEGKRTSRPAPADFFAWVEPRLGPPHFAVIPDVIDGSVSDQRERIAQWPFSRQLGAPVWHMALPIEWLLELADAWPRICFGSTKQFWQVGSPAWARRADEAWNALERRGLRPWVHMLRGMALAGDVWPFASVDSVNVARNFKDQRTCPERMARLIDGRANSPIRWTVRPEQAGLFVA